MRHESATFFDDLARKLAAPHTACAASRRVSLAPMRASRDHDPPSTRWNVVSVVRFQEVINGRTYHIEVLPVARDRWRAQITRTRGGSTALMPFYGATAADAAAHLSHWLARAGRAPVPIDNKR